MTTVTQLRFAMDETVVVGRHFSDVDDAKWPECIRADEMFDLWRFCSVISHGSIVDLGTPCSTVGGTSNTGGCPLRDLESF